MTIKCLFRGHAWYGPHQVVEPVAGRIDPPAWKLMLVDYCSRCGRGRFHV